MHCPRCGNQLIDDDISCSSCGYMEEILGPKKQEKEVHHDQFGTSEQVVHYAGFWRRFSALILDLLILVILEALIAGFIAGTITLMFVLVKKVLDGSAIQGFVGGLGFILLTGSSWIYFVGFESSARQATPGKSFFHLMVSDLDGKRVSLGVANLRYWSKALSVLPVLGGFIMIVFSKRKRALHDLIAGTVVTKQVSFKEDKVDIPPVTQ